MILSKIRGYFGDKIYSGGDGGGPVTKGRASVGVAAKTITGGLGPALLNFSATPKYDSLGELDLVNDRFVASRTGYYHVYIVLYLYTLDAGYSALFNLLSDKNSVTEIVKSKFNQPSSNFFTIYSHYMVYFDSGDVFEFFGNYSGTTTIDIIGDPTRSYIEIYGL
jgi:hypothetical protein